jgi:hypothetical protein
MNLDRLADQRQQDGKGIVSSVIGTDDRHSRPD